jgi:hypothetical protein
VLPQLEEPLVSGDDAGGAALQGGSEVLVVVRVVADAGKMELARDDVRQHDDVLEPELRLPGGADELASTTSKASSRRKRSMSRPGVPSGWMRALT